MRFRSDLEKKSFDRSMKTTKTALAFGQLEKGLTELLESGDWQKYLTVQSKFHNYSFNPDSALQKVALNTTSLGLIIKYNCLSS